MSFPDVISAAGLSSHTFDRISDGKWIEQTTNVDEPFYLGLKSTVIPDGDSSYTLRCDLNRNSTAPSSKDDVLSVYIVIRGNMKVFSLGDILDLEGVIHSFITAEDAAAVANLKRMLRGEK